MKHSLKLISLLLLSKLLTGCFLGAGTHGSLKSYSYAIPKDSLQKAVMAVIRDNPNIDRDTTLDSLGSSPALDYDDGLHSANENYYNDIKHYVSFRITSGKEVNDYTFRYYGADEDWPTAGSSKLFICYAYDKDGKGGSEGNGQVTEEMAKQFIEVFEKEFILKVDTVLSLKHREEE